MICGVLVVMILLNFLPDALSEDKDQKGEKIEDKVEEKKKDK